MLSAVFSHKSWQSNSVSDTLNFRVILSRNCIKDEAPIFERMALRNNDEDNRVNCNGHGVWRKYNNAVNRKVPLDQPCCILLNLKCFKDIADLKIIEILHSDPALISHRGFADVILKAP